MANKGKETPLPKGRLLRIVFLELFELFGFRFAGAALEQGEHLCLPQITSLPRRLMA